MIEAPSDVLDSTRGGQAISMSTGNRTRRICHVLHGLTVGGAEVLAARLGRRLRGTYDISFACLDELGLLGQQLRDEGFRVVVVERRPGFDLSCARRLGRFFRDERIEIAHAHQYTPFFYALLARWPRPRPRILFTEHGRWFPDYPRPKRIVFNRLMLRRHDRVVGVGEAVRQALIHNEGIPATRVGVIHNGIDFDSPPGSADDRARVRQEVGLGASDFVVLQVARLDALKDHATAVRTIRRVIAVRPDVRLLVVGDGPLRDTIENEVRAAGVEHGVRLAGLRTDVPRLLSAADLFLLTSVSEGIPVTVIEAMAAGLPVVSTRVGGLAELVVEEQTGLLAPPGDDAALAACVLRLAADGGLRQEMGRRARERAGALFSEGKMHAGYCRLYDEMLSG